MTLCFATHMASAAFPETPAALSGMVKNAGRCFLRPRRGSFQPLFAFLCFLSAILSTLPDAAFAAPAGLQRFANHAPGRPLLLQTGSGCGWDYPCPPDPGFGRPPPYRGGQVTIHNNYGSVNIYPGVSRRPETLAPAEPGFCREDPCRYGCGGYPCTEKCGALCWMKRFSQGYCGHGCLAYREQARSEAEERAAWQEEEERHHERDWKLENRAGCAPPSCPRDYDPAPPPPPPPYYYRRPEREYAPPPQEPARPDLTPRERFEGPKYPPE